MIELREELEKVLTELQSQLAFVDLLNTNSKKDNVEFLVLRKGHIKLEIYNEKHIHKLPHFHILFKKVHDASYQIDPLLKLAGEMPTQYERPILTWAGKNKAILNTAWIDVNINGKKPVPIIIP